MIDRSHRRPQSKALDIERNLPTRGVFAALVLVASVVASLVVTTATGTVVSAAPTATTTELVLKARVIATPLGTAGVIGTNFTLTNGTVFRLHMFSTLAAGPGAALPDAWATCTITAGGQCVITVPNTNTTQANGGNQGRQFWVVQASPSTDTVAGQPVYTSPSLNLGSVSGPANIRYILGATDTMVANTTQNLPLDLANTDASTWAAPAPFNDFDIPASFGAVANSYPNPVVQASCTAGLKVALVADESSSIATGSWTTFRNSIIGANGLFDALLGSGSSLAYFTFSTDSPSANTVGHANQPNLLSVVEGNRATVSSWIAATPQGGSTNWDRALRVTSLNNTPARDYDVVLFITDGAPNNISNAAGNGGVAVNGTDVTLRSVEAAIYSANAIKSQGTRIVAVGVGAGITGAGPNLRAISGPTLGTDFFQSASWDDLLNQLKTIANGLTCRGTVKVNKTTVSNTNVTTPLAPGWTFTAANPGGLGTTTDSLAQTTSSSLTSASWTYKFNNTTDTTTINIAETGQTNWTQSSVTCGGNPVTPNANGSFGVSVTSGTNVTCTVTNNQRFAPSISTAATNAQLPAGTIRDVATLTGLSASPTGSVTFSLYGPSATATCAAGTAIFTSVKPVGATVTSDSFTPTVAGNYYWIASYPGDANNNAVAGTCGATGETSVVTKAGPSISTAATNAQLPAGTIRDVATLTGLTAGATGTVTFNLYGPSASPTCAAGTAIFTSTVNISGGSATSGSFTPPVAGSYYWVASYNGDANNNAVAGACGATGETSVVTKAAPSIVTAATGAQLPAGTIHDVATLTGLTAGATGTVTFNLYGPSLTADCTGAVVFTSAKPVGATVTSDSFTPPVAGNYYWIASYDGDANNNAVAGACGATDETSTVTPAGPTISTAATDAQLPAGTIHDVATLTGLSATPTGTVTFNLYGPSATADCTGAVVFTSAKPVGATVTSDSFTPTVAGNYYWVASYPGDTNNTAVSGACGDTGETSTVTKAGPSISTVATNAQLPAGTIHDVATLTGLTAGATGTVTFNLYGPSATAVCTGTVVFTSTTSISGGSATSASFTPTVVGDYYWVATYNGDANNTAVAGACGATGETSTVTKAAPTISTVATNAQLPAGTIHDVATLTGLTAGATGSVTFNLYGPSLTPVCTGAVVFTSVKPVGATVTSDSFTPLVAGSYYWIASYPGDANNNAVTGTCGATGETSTVTPAAPSISTAATNAQLPAGTIHDVATLTGLSAGATGTVTFNLYGPSATPDCTGTVVVTSTKPVAATVTSDSFTPTVAGSYYWIASYSGDANNSPVTGACGDLNETSTVSKAAPSIVTVATNAQLPAGTIHDVATLSGLTAEATGSVTFNLYGPSATPDCTGTVVFTSTTPVAATVTSDLFTPTVAGSYYWIASYSGDVNNSPVAGACGDLNETSTVTPAAPSIVTAATDAQLPAGTIHDVATLTGLSASPTGSVTFNLYGPSATPLCAAGTEIFTSTNPVAATVTSDSFTPLVAGNYYWIASYPGDANNNAVTGTCGATGETSTVTPAAPSIVTAATDAQLPAGTIHDVATLTGLSASPTGSVTFSLYGPSPTAVCTGSAIFTSVKPVAATVTSDSFTPTVAGNYYWIASYPGDANNNAVTGTCGATGETSTVTPAAPSISTVATTNAQLPAGTIHDVATLTGLTAGATGTVTFNLYGPSPTAVCTGAVVFTSVKPVAATVTSDSFTPTVAGSYYWIASYPGDANNNAVTGTCGATGETSTVTPAAPSISTAATNAQLPAGTIHDVATLTGLSASPTGSVTFSLYGPSPTPDCTGTPVFASTKPVAATVTSDPFTPLVAGNYYWIARYGGDVNNSPVEGTCGATGETSTVTPAAPSIVTAATGAQLPAGTIHDVATLTGLSATATGSVTFNLYGPSATPVCAAGTEIFTSTKPVAATVTSDSFTPTVAGSYYWIASYDGDVNNSPVTGACGDLNETSTVSKAGPSIVTAATGAQLPAGTIHDVATLSGLSASPTGSVTFNLYGPSPTPDCTGTVVFTSTKPVAATVTSDSFTPTVAGSYYWIASYPGDANNNAVTGTCGATGETSTVTPAAPSISTVATTNAQLPAGTIHDVATLTGLSASPTGSVTFSLYGPSPTPDCTGTPVFASTKPVAATVTSDSFTPLVAGSYYWIARYGGDVNNNPVEGACGATGETSVVSPGPSVTKSGVSVIAGVDGASWDVTYTVAVHNASPDLPLVYSLADMPQFDASVEINTAAVTGSSDGTNPITGIANGGAGTWDPTTKTLTIITTAAQRTLAAGGTDTYTIVVNTAAPADITDVAANCSETGAGHGFYNSATATSAGSTYTDNACLPVPHFTLSKSSNPPTGSTVAPGDVITYTLTIENTSQATLSGIVAHDSLPQFGVDYNGKVSGVGTLTPNPDGSLTWDGIGDIAPGQTVSVSYTVTVNEEAVGRVLRNVVSTNSPGGQCTNCTVAQAVPVLTKSAISVTAGVDGNSWDVTYQITVRNPSEDLPAVYLLRDTPQFDSSLGINSVTVTGTDSSNVSIPVVNTWDGTTLIIIALPGRSLPHDGVDTYTVVVNTAAPASLTDAVADCNDSSGHGFFNTATIFSLEGGLISARDCADVPHWTLAKTANPPSGTPVAVLGSGEPDTSITYTLTATNPSAAAIDGAIASDTLPANVVVADDAAALAAKGLTLSPDGKTITWAVPRMDPRGETPTTVSVSYTVTVLATASSGAPLVNVVAPSTLGGSCLTDADCTTSHPVRDPVADLGIVKNASVTTADRGGTFTWTLDVVNNGPGPAIDAVVTDTVPAPFKVTGISGTAGWTCSNVGNAVTCTKPFVAVGETAHFTISVSTPADASARTIANVGTVSSTTSDSNPANNSDDASVQIPEQIVEPPVPPIVLPPTGSNGPGTLMPSAALLFAAGFVLYRISKRRTANP